mmetsp:Transcript_20617/g.32247  ORF Transcript_20617/g.32247 Transcript_20617/m.32247 type:complete len:95 (-) Transcript_20617:382-666(-)
MMVVAPILWFLLRRFEGPERPPWGSDVEQQQDGVEHVTKNSISQQVSLSACTAGCSAASHCSISSGSGSEARAVASTRAETSHFSQCLLIPYLN